MAEQKKLDKNSEEYMNARKTRINIRTQITKLYDVMSQGTSTGESITGDQLLNWTKTFGIVEYTISNFNDYLEGLNDEYAECPDSLALIANLDVMAVDEYQTKWDTLREFANGKYTQTSFSQKEEDKQQQQRPKQQMSVSPFTQAEVVPKFSGKYEDFRGFWEFFKEIVHDNNELTNTQKHGILLAKLDETTKTKISSLNPKEYLEAVRILEAHFQSVHIVRNNIITEFENFPVIDTKSPKPGSYGNLLTRSRTAYKSLLETTTDQARDTTIEHLRQLIISKIPRCWTYGLLSFGHLQTMEDLLDKMTTLQAVIERPSLLAKPGPEREKKEGRNDQHKRQEETQKASKLCKLCDGQHKTIFCHSKLSPQEKVKIAEERSLCQVCFRNHKTSDCKSKYLCSGCRGRHSRVLCTSPASSSHA